MECLIYRFLNAACHVGKKAPSHTCFVVKRNYEGLSGRLNLVGGINGTGTLPWRHQNWGERWMEREMFSVATACGVAVCFILVSYLTGGRFRTEEDLTSSVLVWL